MMADTVEDLKKTVLHRVFGNEALMEVDVDIDVILGRSLLRVFQLLKLGRGAVIELSQHINDPVTVLANNIPIARGEIVVGEDQIINVKITELIISQSSGSHVQKKEED